MVISIMTLCILNYHKKFFTFFSLYSVKKIITKNLKACCYCSKSAKWLLTILTCTKSVKWPLKFLTCSKSAKWLLKILTCWKLAKITKVKSNHLKSNHLKSKVFKKSNKRKYMIILRIPKNHYKKFYFFIFCVI